MAIEKVVIGNATLYCGDCAEILPTLDKVDAVITDPPYGIGVSRAMHKRSGLVAGHGHRRVAARHYELATWDDSTPNASLIDTIVQTAPIIVIFGGNYFNLPPTKCWLIWDKMNGDNNFADCEMAWTNLDKVVRKIEWLWNGFARQNSEIRYNHPTQKPTGVMQWCIQQAGMPQTILDPFMGSGTTGVACMNLDRKFIGIEIDRKYFDIACQRIEQAQQQTKLFSEPAPTWQQAELLKGVVNATQS